MDVIELKFLLKLLGYPPDYRAPLTKLSPTSSTADRDRACRQLRDRGLIDALEEVLRFKLAPPGKALLRLDAAQLPITDLELAVLQACAQASTTPGQALKRMPALERQTLLQDLAGRGLISLTTRVKEVWLTDQGRSHLLHDYTCKGTATVSLNLLGNYLQFLRQAHMQASRPDGSAALSALRWHGAGQPSDGQILKLIQTLDHELNSDNYLPMFYLRQALQPPLSRDQLDQALYRLQRHDQIELSSLQEAIAYTPDQISAGIPQDIGGCLFFVSLVKSDPLF